MSSHSPPILLFNVNNHTDNNDNNSNSIADSIKTSVLIIILILSLTTLLSVSLCLLLRHLNRRCLRLLSRSSTTSTLTPTPSASSNRHSGHRVSPETPASFSFVDSLPLFSFGSIRRRSATSIASGDCAVCLNSFEQEDLLRLLPLCCHAFHAQCIDTWLHANLTCPLCRSPIHASDSDLMKALSTATSDPGGLGGGGGGSFRLEIGSVSRRHQAALDSAHHEPRSSYSVGSFDYVVEEESEVTVSQTHRRSVSDKESIGSLPEAQEPSLAAEVASGGRSWLKDYIDRLSTSVSSRAMSFRGSGRFFTGSSRRSETTTGTGDYDLEANRVGEEISEFFRWFSGV